MKFPFPKGEEILPSSRGRGDEKRNSLFYQYLYPLKEYSIIFNVFRYITVRAIGASITAFLLCVILGPHIIKWLQGLSIQNETKRADAEKIHQFFAHKDKVPTMGGILIVLSVLIACILWGNFNNLFFSIALLSLCAFCIVGFLDDITKLKSQSSKGLSARVKFFGQLGIGIVLGGYMFLDPGIPKEVSVPFIKYTAVPLGILFIPWVMFVLVGASNAINLTDGLDGLAIGCFAIAMAVFGLISYVVGRYDYTNYLELQYIERAGELSVFCAAMVGAGIGFLWYNSYPATIMMGDTGSLSLGGALGTVAILIQKELVLLVVGGVFVWEALSVMLQVFSFKTFGKRIFLMSPFHHHLQLKGWPESKVTIRLWIIAVILALVGLSTLKLR